MGTSRRLLGEAGLHVADKPPRHPTFYRKKNHVLMAPFKIVDHRKSTILLSAGLVALLTVWYFIGTISSLKQPAMTPGLQHSYIFESVPGVFLQDDPATDWETFDFTKHNFGLIDREYPTDSADSSGLQTWQRLDRWLKSLVKNAPDGVTYKLLYMGRHGQGHHNVAESFYGTEAWDDYWSKLEGNGTVVWADAHLTEEGQRQILDAHEFIAHQLSKAAMPAPDTYYVSPLYRCLQTADLTWSKLDLPAEKPFAPIIKELLREVLGVHTCDRRSSKTVIHSAVPEWRIEPGFSEHDLLWSADHRETHDEHDIRTTAFLNDIFDHDPSLYISLTSHSGAIASKLRVLGHRLFRLPTGGMIPVLVKATRIRK